MVTGFQTGIFILYCGYQLTLCIISFRPPHDRTFDRVHPRSTLDYSRNFTPYQQNQQANENLLPLSKHYLNGSIKIQEKHLYSRVEVNSGVKSFTSWNTGRKRCEVKIDKAWKFLLRHNRRCSNLKKNEVGSELQYKYSNLNF